MSGREGDNAQRETATSHDAPAVRPTVSSGESYSQRRARENAALAREYFPAHRAEYSEGMVGGVRVERLVWRKPGTNMNRIDFVCVHGTRLCVTGDLGDAIYSAGAESLAWWTRCDLDYFAGKCDASETGRGFKDWDDEAAMARFDEEVKRMREDDGETVDEDVVAAGRDALAGGRGEWDTWMRESASELFGDEWWDYVPNFGVIVHPRCRLHLIGLKTALAQLATSATLPDESAVGASKPATDAPAEVTP